MTVLDTSVVVDHLLRGPGSAASDSLMGPGYAVAPDVLVFEVLSAVRRLTLRGELAASRATGAVNDLGDARIHLWPSLPLRHRAWELRHRLTAADALFVALAEQLGEPLMTMDAALARGLADHSPAEVVVVA